MSWVHVGLGLLCLCAATPPRWFPGAEFLIVPGLVAFYSVARADGGRRRLAIWALGAFHTWVFSFSLAAEFFPGWALIGFTGGFYWVGAAWVARRLDRRWLPAPVGFGAAVALCFWARAHMPEVHYPHGQPSHALYLWPGLLEPVRWGGEVLANALLGAIAAAIADLWGAWKVGAPAMPRARGQALAVAAIVGLLVLVPAPRAAAGPPGTVRVAAIEPGAAPNFQMRDETRLPVEAALVERTQHVAGRGVADAPDLVIWPESSHPGALLVEEGGFQGALPLDLAPGVRLIVGALVIERRGEVRAERVWRPCAALLDERGNYLAHQDKLVCVPGGEAFPLARWLPFVRDLGFAFGVPHFTPGEFRPPLPLADGTLVGGVTCYENAFPWVAGRQVDAGARLLAVVTNEAWYHRGGELWQMDAMTVLRALETDTPVVRCTVDGSTIAVGSDGRFLARLPVPGAREPREPRILEVEIDLGPGALPPMAWMHPYWGWAFVLLSLIGNAHISGRGGKLLRLRQRDSAGAAPTSGDS